MKKGRLRILFIILLIFLLVLALIWAYISLIGEDNNEQSSSIIPLCKIDSEILFSSFSVGENKAFINSEGVINHKIKEAGLSFVFLARKDESNLLFKSSFLKTKEGESYYESKIIFSQEGIYNLSICKGIEGNLCCMDLGMRINVESSPFGDILPLYPDHNKKNADRINIIFLGANYPSMDLFLDITKQAISFNGQPTEILISEEVLDDGSVKEFNPPKTYKDIGFFAMEPFRSNKDKFNLWYFENQLTISFEDLYRATQKFSFVNLNNTYFVLLTYGLNSSIRDIGSGGYAYLPSQEICDLRPGESIEKSHNLFGSSVLSGKPAVSDNFEVISGYENYSRYIYLAHSSMFSHETGHGMFCLRDEYQNNEMVDGVAKYPNCASSLDEAKTYWGDLIGEIDPFFEEAYDFLDLIAFGVNEEDFKINFVKGGCGTPYGGGSNYRPTKRSLMSTSDPILGAVNRQRVEQVLNSFSGK